MHQANNNAIQRPFLPAVTAIENVFINNTKCSTLTETGCSENVISSKVIAKLKISCPEKAGTVSMATPNLKSEIKGYCIISMT